LIGVEDAGPAGLGQKFEIKKKHKMSKDEKLIILRRDPLDITNQNIF